MNLFLIYFFLIYGTAHLYFYLKLNSGFSPSVSARFLLAIFLLAMIVAPVAVRLLERDGHENIARTTAYIGYNWMGFLFLFISLAFLLEAMRFLLWLGHFFTRMPRPYLLESAPFMIFCLLVAAGISIYGWFEAQDLRIERRQIYTEKLPPGSQPIKIAQITDLHIGLIVREKQVNKVVAAIHNIKPDLLVATGDIVDGHVSHFDGISELFKGLELPLGMVAIPGNHEYYAGFGQARQFLLKSGFTFMRSEARAAGENLWLVGIDDPVAKRSGDFRSEDEARLLSEAPRDKFIVMLKHRPVVEKDSLSRFDLQLSGHVHKGQIFPFNLLTWISFPVRAGLTQPAESSWLYVSRGTGTWGPPIRFMSPPEVSVIELLPKQR